MSRFLAPYLSYIQQCTDAPVEFGHAAGLMCLSGITMGRRWLTSGHQANLYMLLVGPSSRDRKSTSISKAMDILEAVEPDRIGPSDFTLEGILSRLAVDKSKPDKSTIVLPIPEFGTYLAQSKKTYMQGSSSTLCQLYDGDTVQRMRARETIVVKEPKVCLFGGAAHGFLEKYAEPADWEGGFFARMIFVVGKTRTHRFSTPQAKNDFARAAIVGALSDLNAVLKAYPGGHPLDVSAQQTYESFVQSIPDDTQGGPAVVAQRERLLNTIPKLALLYQIDDNPSSPITANSVLQAIEFFKMAWDSFKFAYGLSSGSGRTKLLRRIWRKISYANNRVMRRRDLLRAFTMSMGEIAPALEDLKKMGVVGEVVKDNVHFYHAKISFTEAEGDVDITTDDDERSAPKIVN